MKIKMKSFGRTARFAIALVLYALLILIVMGLWIVEKFGLLGPLLFVLCILMLVDYFSGMLAAKKEALEHPGNRKYGWNSRKGCR